MIAIESSDALKILKLLEYPEKNPTYLLPDLHPELDKKLERTFESKEDGEGKVLWICKTIANIQKNFVAAFVKGKAGSYYEAWRLYAHCEMDLEFLSRHFIHNSDDAHRIEYIRLMTKNWQSLYPYRLFFSIELLEKRILCSICGARITPHSNCGHIVGEIYGGKHCLVIVDDMEIIGVSLVENPLDKTCVAFLSDSSTEERADHYDYSAVKFVLDAVDSAFQRWNPYTTTREIPASELSHIKSTDRCPCASGKEYQSCCAGKSRVTVPHLQIQLS